jgi:hypothetical protein
VAAARSPGGATGSTAAGAGDGAGAGAGAGAIGVEG